VVGDVASWRDKALPIIEDLEGDELPSADILDIY